MFLKSMRGSQVLLRFLKFLTNDVFQHFLVVFQVEINHSRELYRPVAAEGWRRCDNKSGEFEVNLFFN